METKLCACGRVLYPRFNSKFYNKLCPACQLAQAKDKKTYKGEAIHTSSAAMRTADRHFSHYIRMLYSFPDASGKELLCKCYTCKNIKRIKSIQLGHYHGRGIKATRYHLNNGRPQCVRCNKHLSGAHTAFERALVEEVGAKAVQELKSLTVAYFKADKAFFRAASRTYLKLLNEQYKIKGIKPWKTTSRKG